MHVSLKFCVRSVNVHTPWTLQKIVLIHDDMFFLNMFFNVHFSRRRVVTVETMIFVCTIVAVIYVYLYLAKGLSRVVAFAASPLTLCFANVTVNCNSIFPNRFPLHRFIAVDAVYLTSFV